MLLALPLLAVLCQCNSFRSPEGQVVPPPLTQTKTSPRKLFVFMDGTNNQWTNRTNVRRLFEMLAARENPDEISCYISGVGTGGNILGLGLGLGMKPRVCEGYAFLSRHYQPGDEIYIFGFSRGALQARTLSGIISYSGLLPASLAGTESSARRNAAKVFDHCRKIEEDDESLDWRKSTPPVSLFTDDDGKSWQGIKVPVRFVGVWDTVPGSQFKYYSLYRESACDRSKGTRYKISVYPPMREVAHAMSIDECRSQFTAVMVAPPGDSRVDEQWFPGVHSDVGGGYDDTNGLSGVSMNWMIGKLNAAARFKQPLPKVHEDALAAQHESYLDFPENLGSSKLHRIIPAGATLHPSVAQRMKARGLEHRGKKSWCFLGSAKFQPLDKYDPPALRPQNRPKVGGQPPYAVTQPSYDKARRCE